MLEPNVQFSKYTGVRQQCNIFGCTNDSEFKLKNDGSPSGQEVRMCADCSKKACMSIVSFYKAEKEEREQSMLDSIPVYVAPPKPTKPVNTSVVGAKK